LTSSVAYPIVSPMLIAEDEALACLKVLVAIAQADGKVKADEKKSLAAAISSFDLPVGVSVDGLLAEAIDIAGELGKITSAEAREQVYRSAFFLAHADGDAAPEERALLAQIEAATAPSDALRSQMAGLEQSSSRGATLMDSLRALFRSKT